MTRVHVWNCGCTECSESREAISLEQGAHGAMKLKPNMTVGVRTSNALGGWVIVPAILMRHKPYRGCDGWDVSYPAATEQWHCHGGWVMTNCITDAPAPAASTERAS